MAGDSQPIAPFKEVTQSMQASRESPLWLLSDGLEIEYRGAIPGIIVRSVVAQTAQDLEGMDGAPAPMEAIEPAVRRRLVNLITLPRQRRAREHPGDGGRP